MESKGLAFRRLLATQPYVFTGGVYSPLDAQIAERVGVKAIYLSGYSMAMANGWPDMGFLTQTEVARTAHMVASAVDIPVIASGGAGAFDHFAEVFTAGRADAALAASIFHFNEHSVSELKQFLRERGVPVRM